MSSALFLKLSKVDLSSLSPLGGLFATEISDPVLEVRFLRYPYYGEGLGFGLTLSDDTR